MALVIDQADPVSGWRQTQVGVVLSEQQPVFCPRREQAIWLAQILTNKVIDHDADVGLIAPENERRLAVVCRAALIPAIKPLGGSFLVAGRSVDLAGEEQAGDRLGFESQARLVGWT